MRDLNEEMIEAGSKVRDRYQKLSVAFFNTDFRPEV